MQVFEMRVTFFSVLRMLKVGDTTCNVQESFEKAIRKCYAPYEEQYEDKETTIPDFRKYSSEAA